MNDFERSLLATLLSFASANAVAEEGQRFPPGTGNWIITETTSPVDYSPVVVATTRSRDSVESSAMQLSAYCRNGQTYLVLTGETISARADHYAVSYSTNGDKPARVGVSASSFGPGLAFQGDVVSLLQSFPDGGELAIRLSTLAGSTTGYFSLSGLKVVRNKMAAACRWPHADTQSRN